MGMSNQKLRKSYSPRFQTPRRRFRVTNYTKRIKMLRPNLKKYTIKHRLVVRLTNSRVIAQIITAHSTGDKVVCQANSSELKKFGLEVGLTNYSACYATGLLLAKRIQSQYKMDEQNAVIQSGSQDKNDSEESDESKVLTCFLDIGFKKSTKGSRVYAVLKGGVDGGLYIPHNEERIFPQELEGRIHGETISNYMKVLENDKEKYDKQFSQFSKHGIDQNNVRQTYEEVF